MEQQDPGCSAALSYRCAQGERLRRASSPGASRPIAGRSSTRRARPTITSVVSSGSNSVGSSRRFRDDAFELLF